MAVVEHKDSVKDATTTTGTGTFTVIGTAFAGYRPMSSHTSGATVRYRAESADKTSWEVGSGVWSSGANTLTRVTVHASSNSGSLVSFPAGTTTLYTVMAAEDIDNIPQTAMPVLTSGNPTVVVTERDFYNLGWSAGAVSGFALTDNGNGTVNIAAGEAILRDAATSTAPLTSYPFSATTNLAINDNTLGYIYVDQNSGTPIVAYTSTLSTINCQNRCILYKIARYGSVLKYVDATQQNVDSNRKHRHRFLLIENYKYANGMVIAATGTRNFSISAGEMFFGLVDLTTPAFDTSASSSFTYAYFNGTAWVRTTGNTQIDNTNYNNVASGLAALSTGNYGVHYVFLVPGSPTILTVVYGTGNYNTLALAQAAGVPSSLPPEMGLAMLVGRIIIKKSQAAFADLSSAFTTIFSAGTPADHSSLTNLAWAASGHTGTATTLAGFDAGGAAAAVTYDTLRTLPVGGTVGGTADAITLTPTPAIASYAAAVGTEFRFTAGGTNTVSPPTINISGLGALNTTMGSVAVPVGGIISGNIYRALIETSSSIRIAPYDAASTNGDTFNGPISVPNVNLGYTTTATAAGTTTLTATSNRKQFFTGTTTQTCQMPVTSTLVLGQEFEIVNESTGAVTVTSSGSNTIASVAASTSVRVTCVLTSGTTAASWSYRLVAKTVGGGTVPKMYRIKNLTSYGATYTPQSDVVSLLAMVFGATGGRNATSASVGGPGYSEKYYTSPAATYTLTIGAGGANTGASGGTTSFITGGVGPSVAGSAGLTTTNTGGTGGSGSGGDANFTGGTGGSNNGVTSYGGGAGRASRAGNGGNGADASGTTGGGGGGSGGNNASGATAGTSASARSGSVTSPFVPEIDDCLTWPAGFSGSGTASGDGCGSAAATGSLYTGGPGRGAGLPTGRGQAGATAGESGQIWVVEFLN